MPSWRRVYHITDRAICLIPEKDGEPLFWFDYKPGWQVILEVREAKLWAQLIPDLFARGAPPFSYNGRINAINGPHSM